MSGPRRSDGEHEITLAGDLAVDGRRARARADVAADLAQFDFQAKISPGLTWRLKRTLSSPAKNAIRPVYSSCEHRDRPDLGDGFDDQHARHDGIVRKMTLKKGSPIERS